MLATNAVSDRPYLSSFRIALRRAYAELALNRRQAIQRIGTSYLDRVLVYTRVTTRMCHARPAGVPTLASSAGNNPRHHRQSAGPPAAASGSPARSRLMYVKPCADGVDVCPDALRGTRHRPSRRPERGADSLSPAQIPSSKMTGGQNGDRANRVQARSFAKAAKFEPVLALPIYGWLAARRASMRAMYFLARSASAISEFRLMVVAKCLRAGTRASSVPEACALLV